MSIKKTLTMVSLRLWMGLSIVLMTVCIILVMTLFNTASRIHVTPQLFRRDAMSADQFIEATAIHPEVSLKERRLIDEMLIRFYVENRHFYLPDIAELRYRYGNSGPVARLSIPSVYRTFIKGKGNYLENVQSNPRTTSVDIWNVTRRDNVFYVDFDIYHFADNRQSFGGTKRATIKIDHRWNPSWYRRSYNGDFFNPYGFVVTEYSESNLKKR